MRSLLLTIAFTAVTLPEFAFSEPPVAQTWFEPSASLTGSSGERFGSSLACSGPVGSYSYIAVGASEYNSGAGRVYIYSSENLSAPIQTIYSSSPGAGNRFGAAVAFTKDINGDDKADLVISEPKPNGGQALVYMYLSQPSGDPFWLCGVSALNLAPGSVTELLNLVLQSGSLPNVARLVTGSPALHSLGTMTITYVAGACTFNDSPVNGYTAQGLVGSWFGGALAEIAGGNSIDSDIAVGAPDTSIAAGYVGLVPRDGSLQDVVLGTAEQRVGTTVAGDPITGHFAYSVPNDDILRIQHSLGSGSYVSVCQAAIPMSDMPATAGRGLRLMGSAFTSFLGGGGSDVSYASYRTQPNTGGSVALVSTLLPGPCGSIYTFNNCIFDVNQEQGRVLAGGATCVKNVNGTSVPMLLVGSPGWDSSAGRVDIVLEGTQLNSAKLCTGSNPTPTPTPAVATPIPVGSGTGGLPAPTVESVGTKSAVIVLPTVRVGSSFASFLSKKLKVSRKEAERMASGAALTYEVIVSPTVRASAAEVSAMATTGKLQKVRTRKQRVTVSRLAPGTTYRVSYRVEISIKKPKKTFFTKQSSSTTLRTSK